ncbi:MAG: lamin tail domain-containing protein, partial [Kiritimatiellales bacterium]|nr:lamin tail domain-containing protein [Kiritimatiellales bacterium]
VAGGGITVLARSPEDLTDRYPGIVPDGAFPASSLQNGGERIELALNTGIRSDVLSAAATGDDRGAITVSSVPAGLGEGDRLQVFLSTNYCNNRIFTIQSVEGNIVYVDEPLSGETGGSKAFFYDVLTSVEYNDRAPWPIPADGYGYSLVPSNPDSSADPDLAAEWRASANPNGSPGTDDPSPEVTVILVNEVLTHTDQPERDTIELYNPNGEPVNISGWYLTDNRDTPQKWVIPAGTTIPANGYIAFYEGHYVSTNLEFAANEFGSAFSLRATGDEVYLFSPTLGYSHGFSFEGAFNGVGFGRYVTSQGEEHFPSQISFTPQTVNSGPAVGPVVITEIMYNPATGGNEFIELANISPSPVPLYDPSSLTNTWTVGGIGFEFPPYTEIGVGKVILLVRDTITPEAFRTSNNIPGDVQIFSYDGKLDNGGETITLRAPDEPVKTGANAGEVPYIIVDRVKYDDSAPWPAGADGAGLSLERIDSRAYGDDVINWHQSESSGGTPGIGGGTPTDPLIALSRTGINVSIEQGQTADDETFDIWNSGTNRLDYLVQENSALFSVTPADGSSSGAIQRVTHTVSFATAALAEGLHQANITVADNESGALNGPLSIMVSIVVNPPPSPEIALDTTMLTPSVTEGGNAGSSTFNVWNGGTGTLTYSISDNAAWMSVSPSGGTSTSSGNRQSHTVTYNTAGLPAGDYTGTITVSDPDASGSPQTIPVQLTVREPILFTAYNDLSWAVGQISAHITRYTTDSGDGTPPAGSSGLLIDQATGEETGVTLSVSGGDWNGGNHLTQGLDADPGTDANSLFDAKVSCQGIISYGTGNILLRFSGMDTNMTYTLALFSNRAEYDDRNSLFTISDVDCFTNESSAGAGRSSQAMPEDSVTIIANNTARGYVAKYSQIDPGADGDMLITIAGTHSYVNALMLCDRIADPRQ